MKQLALFIAVSAFFIYLGFSSNSIKPDPKVFTDGPARIESQVILPKGERLVNMWGDASTTSILTIDTEAVYHWRKISPYDGLSNEIVIKESWQAGDAIRVSEDYYRFSEQKHHNEDSINQANSVTRKR